MNLSPTDRRGPSFLLIVLCLFPIAKAVAGYWEDQFAFPAEFQSVPEGAAPPAWSKNFNVIGILQLRDDLGRQQAEQLDRLARRMGGEVDVGLYSIDRVGPHWAPEYLSDFRENRNVDLPVFEVPPDAMREFFRGYQPKPVEIYPQVRLFGPNRRLLGTFHGFQTAERIEGAIEGARKALGPWMKSLPEPAKAQIVQNGDFEEWDKDKSPPPWIWNDSTAPDPARVPRRGWKASSAMEIRAATSGDFQLVYQTLQISEALAGKRMRLSAAVQTNCIARPVVTLAVAHPSPDSDSRFVPEPPFKTSAGTTVPMRMIGTLDFAQETPAWIWKSVEFDYPVGGPIPTELLTPTLFIYLNNPKDTGGAALIDEVRLDILD
jgi:hypothetical protein